MPRPWTLPSGMTMETMDEYVREHTNAARRASYANHPERVLRQRLTCAANLLHRYGLLNDDERHDIDNAIKAVIAHG